MAAGAPASSRPDASECAAREALVDAGRGTDARPTGSAHPLAHLWDNLAEPLAGLDQAAEVRRAALERLGATSIRPGRPLATVQEALVPTYLYHRYQIEAASKLVAGVNYAYAITGTREVLPSPVPAAAQREAIRRLLSLVAPSELGLPIGLRTSLPPRPPGFPATREVFSSYADPMPDAYVPAEVLSGMIFGLLLDPARTARLVYQGDADSRMPSLIDLINEVSERVWREEPPNDAYLAEIERIVQQVWIDQVVATMTRPSLAPGVRSGLFQHLTDLRAWLLMRTGDDFETQAHRAHAYDQIDRYLVRVYNREERVASPDTPPGQPIGSGESSLRRVQGRQAWLTAWDDLARACSMDHY